jgi:elongation factor 3
MKEVCETLDNIDVVPFLPALISCIARPEEVPECVYKLSATTFVQQVEAPTLSIMVPLLVRALTERKPAVQRQTVVIIDNMCKLVEDPADAHQFLPKLMPGLDRIIEIAADPELREVANRARATMIRVGGGSSDDAEDPAAVKTRLEKEHKDTENYILAQLSKSASSKIDALTISYIASLITVMYDTRVLSLADWTPALAPFMDPFLGHEKSKIVIKALLDRAVQMDKLRQKAADDYDADEGEELCNCEFSLAYGGMILLNNTKLRLTRGQRYGLCGPNGAGYF